MSINKYLDRIISTASNEGKHGTAFAAKVAKDGVNYGDRLLGVTSRKLKNQAELAAKVRPVSTDPHVRKTLKAVERKAESAAEASSKTRFNTAVTLGTGALAYKAKKMYDSYNNQGYGNNTWYTRG